MEDTGYVKIKQDFFQREEEIVAWNNGEEKKIDSLNEQYENDGYIEEEHDLLESTAALLKSTVNPSIVISVKDNNSNSDTKNSFENQEGFEREILTENNNEKHLEQEDDDRDEDTFEEEEREGQLKIKCRVIYLDS